MTLRGVYFRFCFVSFWFEICLLLLIDVVFNMLTSLAGMNRSRYQAILVMI